MPISRDLKSACHHPETFVTSMQQSQHACIFVDQREPDENPIFFLSSAAEKNAGPSSQESVHDQLGFARRSSDPGAPARLYLLVSQYLEGKSSEAPTFCFKRCFF